MAFAWASTTSCREALKLKDEQLSSALPRYAMLSMKHETQYSRLFRS